MLDVREVFHCSVNDLSEDELFAAIVEFSNSPSSRFWVKLNDGKRRLHPLELILMDIFDAIERLSFLFLSANSKKKPKKPFRYPRWWEKQEEKGTKRKVRMMTRKDAAAFYQNMVKKRDASISNEEIQRRNKAYNDALKSRKEK
jgi:hypothetical protein